MKWIKHDTDASMDAKLQSVLLEYGLEGTGLYWYCLELIGSNVSKDNMTFQLEHSPKLIARNTGSCPGRIQSIIDYFVEVGLFEISGNKTTCIKIGLRLDQSMTSNPKTRELIKVIKQNHDRVMTESRANHDGVMTKSGLSHDEIMTESCKNRREEIRTEENRPEQTPFQEEKLSTGVEAGKYRAAKAGGDF